MDISYASQYETMIGCIANGVTELRPISYEAGREELGTN